ncbi:protein starmaker-like [Lutzomyia longipalpis]|uniref:protein starmaker-like n=1 Tax=Lutzomyia longipalpis TaxID=7200 RepID=UPI0024846E3D|nr:protein starmaker-like [Lutzomyia longipalpis]XP_055677470.1 protein starmaker-like [Lutzomyia longipalpis]
MEHVNEKSSLTASGSDHEVMDSWTFVDESRNSAGQQQHAEETSGNPETEESHPQSTEMKTDKYHLSVDQDNDTELSDGISIISDSDCGGGRHSPEIPPKETQSRSTDTSFIPPPTPPETPLTVAREEKRLVEVDNQLVEKEVDVVRGIFGIGRRHVIFVVLLAGISGAMFGHIFRLNPGVPCDCTKLIEPLMSRVYDLEVENFKLRDEVTKLTNKILSDLQGASPNPSNQPQNPQNVAQEGEEEKIWAGDTGEATVKPLVDESICGADTGDDLFDDYYGKVCREAEKRIKEARKAFDEDPNWQKTPWKPEPPKEVRQEKKYEKKEKYDERKKEKYPNGDDWKDSKEDRRNAKEKRKNYRDERKNSKEDKRDNVDRRDFDDDDSDEKEDRKNSKEYKKDFKEDRRGSDEGRRDSKEYRKDSKEDKRNNSKEDRRNNSKEERRNSKERFDERKKKDDDDWSGEDYRKQEKRSEKMKKGERKDYDDFKDSRERKNGDRKRDKKYEKKWKDDDDDDSKEDRSKEFDTEWHEKRMNGREQFREKESGEKNGNWYLERGSDREIKRLRVDGSGSHERRR